jgi:pyrroline-5-carboxylate reductase
MPTGGIVFRQVGFVGAGRMATALAIGFVKSGKLAAGQIMASDPDSHCRDEFQKAISGCKVVSGNDEVARFADLLILAVKPQHAKLALEGIALSKHESIAISVMAGVTVATLQSWLGTNRVIRAIPNTPCLIGSGAIGVASSQYVDKISFESIVHLLKSVGRTTVVPESLLDAVTGLSGSGPAFVFAFIDSLIRGGVQSGLPIEAARSLAIQTIRGSVELLEKSGLEPGNLIAQVTSPGGTTMCGLDVLRDRGFNEAVVQAVRAATERATEMAVTFQ